MSSGRTGLQAAVLETTWGSLCIDASERGVRSCRLPEAPDRPVPFHVLRARFPRGGTPLLRRALAYARAMVEGRAPGACPALDEAVVFAATEFQRAIWKALSEIPRGDTATYGELAGRAGHPRAARAAGSACGANPLPLFIPCHRALAAGGRLGGFSGGLAWKIHLLSKEGVER